MPIRTSYAKNIQERRGKVTELPSIKRKHRPTKDTRWAIMINGKQNGDIMNTTEECYVYIEKHNLSSKLPQLKRID